MSKHEFFGQLGQMGSLVVKGAYWGGGKGGARATKWMRDECKQL